MKVYFKKFNLWWDRQTFITKGLLIIIGVNTGYAAGKLIRFLF